VQTRYAGFVVVGIFVSAFSGILGYGISQLKNHGSGPSWWGQHYGPTEANPDIEPGVLPGIAGWRWIFILYGTLTATIGLVAYVLLVDFPENATRTFLLPFLKANEVDFVVARLEKDRRDVVAEP
jgi:ABC-type phosphate transport system permease subunit